jgi:hypothetical protein
MGINFFRVIGRIAFPIFVFLIAEGFRHSKDRVKFLTRLGIFAIISEIPFDLAFGRQINFFANTNIFYTLFLGGAAIVIADKMHQQATETVVRGKHAKTPDFTQQPLAFLPLIAAMFFAATLSTDYGAVGVAFIFCMYFVKHNAIRLATMSIFCVLTHDNILLSIYHFGFESVDTISRWMVLATLIPVFLVAFYNGERGKNLKWFFYLAYPLHLIVLVILKSNGMI